jgi:hypothetical protein
MKASLKFLLLLIIALLSFIIGYQVNKKSESMVLIEAEEKAHAYMDSVLSIPNNVAVINYINTPYSDAIIRKGSITPKDGYVPDAKTAVRIAISIWSSLYGEQCLEEKTPYEVSLKEDSVWVVRGTLLPGYEGGTPYIELLKENGVILVVNKGK